MLTRISAVVHSIRIQVQVCTVDMLKCLDSLVVFTNFCQVRNPFADNLYTMAQLKHQQLYTLWYTAMYTIHTASQPQKSLLDLHSLHRIYISQ